MGIKEMGCGCIILDFDEESDEVILLYDCQEGDLVFSFAKRYYFSNPLEPIYVTKTKQQDLLKEIQRYFHAGRDFKDLLGIINRNLKKKGE